MIRNLKTLFLILLAHFVSGQTNNADSTGSNIQRDSAGIGIAFTYETFNNQVNASYENSSLDLHNSFHWIGFEQIYSEKFASGISASFYFKGLWTNTTFKTKQDIKLKGFRMGYNYGYRFLFWKRLMLEPTLSIQYCNVRIKDKINSSKLKHNGILLGPELGFQILVLKHTFIGFSAGYLWDLTSPNWKESRSFSSTISAEPLLLDGLYLSIKLGILDEE